jgi:putative transposase
MDGCATPSFYHHHRFPAEMISHSVWLYLRFVLNFRDVEEMFSEAWVDF